jgi:hypothetical protein
MLRQPIKKAGPRVWQRYQRTIRRLALQSILAVATALAAQEAPNAQPEQTPDVPAPAPAPAAQAPLAEPPTLKSPPLAIVPLDASVSGAAQSVAGSMQAWNGRAFITSNGEITAGSRTALVTLPYRGTLNVCPSTTVKLSVDSTVPASEVPGLLIAFDTGSLEANFAIAKNADMVMTPDLRILVSGPGSADLKVRLGDGGDTCVDNAGANAPYVVVTSVFDSGLYRVEPGQRVLFQHGSLQEVVDQEQEPCGCPPAATPERNEFPLAQSQGLAPTAPSSFVVKNPDSSQGTEVLSYSGATRSFGTGASKPAPSKAATDPIVTPPPSPPPPPPPPQKKPRFIKKVGSFLKHFFGAD